jgi:hypothetical protein
MRELHNDFIRLVAWAFVNFVILPGAWIAVFLALPRSLFNDWFILPILLYCAVPAALATFTGIGRAHFTLWLPHPVTGLGWFLLFLFYSGLSVFVAWMVFRIRRGRRHGRTGAC